MDKLLEPSAQPWVALLLDLSGLALLVLYHLYLRGVYRREPCRTYHHRSNRMRRAWVAAMRGRGIDVLPIQTLRNWVMSATLLASTSILIGLGVGHVAFSGLDLSDLARSLSAFPPTSGRMVRVKLLVLAAIFFSAFYNFSLALRYYNQVGFMINVPDETFPADPVDAVADTLNRASGHYHKGNRIFLLAAPFVLWLVGPLWFLIGVCGEIAILYRYDIREDAREDAAEETRDPTSL